MSKIKNNDDTKCCQEWRTRTQHDWWEGKTAQLLWKTVWQFLINLK